MPGEARVEQLFDATSQREGIQGQGGKRATFSSEIRLAAPGSGAAAELKLEAECISLEHLDLLRRYLDSWSEAIGNPLCSAHHIGAVGSVVDLVVLDSVRLLAMIGYRSDPLARKARALRRRWVREPGYRVCRIVRSLIRPKWYR